MATFWFFLILLLLGLTAIFVVVTAVMWVLRMRTFLDVPPLPRKAAEQKRYGYDEGVPEKIRDCMTRRGHAKYENDSPPPPPASAGTTPFKKKEEKK